MTITDIIGHEIKEGDYVVYPQSSGSSVQMVLGRVVEFIKRGVKVQRIEGTRWTPYYISTRYIDNRTGKGIIPFATKHFKTPPYYEVFVKETNEKAEISYEEYINLNWYNKVKYATKYNEGVFKDYVETAPDVPVMVIIRNIKNLIWVDYKE